MDTIPDFSIAAHYTYLAEAHENLIKGDQGVRTSKILESLMNPNAEIRSEALSKIHTLGDLAIEHGVITEAGQEMMFRILRVAALSYPDILPVEIP